MAALRHIHPEKKPVWREVNGFAERSDRLVRDEQ